MTSPVKRSVIPAAPRAWHQMVAGETLAQLAVNPGEGLADRESARRLEEIGANQLMAAEKIPWWCMLLAQFQDFRCCPSRSGWRSWASGRLSSAWGVCALVVVAGLLAAEDLTSAEVSRLFMAGISLAVAAIPEGLPAIVTVALALGVVKVGFALTPRAIQA